MLKYFKKQENPTKKDKEISLIVENTPPNAPLVVKVTKSLLMKHSGVLKKMSENGELKKSREIKLKGITAIGLQKMVEYIKEGCVFFQTHFEVIETLKAAYLYQVPAMNDRCCDFLIDLINCSNVCDIYQFVSSYPFQEVEYHCLKFIDFHAEEVLRSSPFMQLKSVTVSDIIKRHSLDVPSEMTVFRAVLTWGLNDCMRRGANSESTEEIFKSVKSLLTYVRFLDMSLQEVAEPDVDKFYKLLNADNSGQRRVSLHRMDSKTSRSGTHDSSNLQPREYVDNYVYELEMLDCDKQSVRNGETFCLRIEGLKGRVFLTGVVLAFDKFVRSKNTSCLYVALSATNVTTADQICTRGTFMISEEEAVMKFPNPLVLKESESVEVALNVKRAINISPMVIKSDCQIAMPESKDVALKIMPASTTGTTGRSMYRSIRYFY